MLLFPGGHAAKGLSTVYSHDYPGEVVWRGEYKKTPEEAEKAGGLLSPCMEKIGQGANFSHSDLNHGASLYAHSKMDTQAVSQYVSVTEDLAAAFWLANAQQFDQEGTSEPIYLYKIHASRWMIPVHASLGIHSSSKLRGELCAVGRIPWDQIMGWYEITDPVTDLTDIGDGVKIHPGFHANPKYNASLYDHQRIKGQPQPQLAGFPVNSAAWAQEPWRKYRSNAVFNLLGKFVWRKLCSRRLSCYLKYRPRPHPTSLSGTGAGNDPPATRIDPPHHLFIGHYLWPAEALKQGGFLPAADHLYRGHEAPEKAYTLAEHLDLSNHERSSFFLPAFENFGAAAEHAVKLSDHHTPGYEGVVYVISATPNMVDIGLSLGKYYGNLDPTKQRFAVVGGVLWTQVLGWLMVPGNYTRPSTTLVANRRGLHARLKTVFEKQQSYFIPNQDYDKDRFQNLTANNQAQPQLFRSNKPKMAMQKFMELYGAAVGWEGSFPLFGNKGDLWAFITGSMSSSTKALGGVTHPHDLSNLRVSAVWMFMTFNVVAWCVMPALLVAFVLQNAGESVAAEVLANLGADAVQRAGIFFDAASEATGDAGSELGASIGGVSGAGAAGAMAGEAEEEGSFISSEINNEAVDVPAERAEAEWLQEMIQSPKIPSEPVVPAAAAAAA
ncbi:putative enterotoxin [Ophiocordyceps camponoti-rufipedis]|uniref:Putative enterotoxin n=1 Tax=Ophiocordyceps camponoti-rufipedis TaxID=2004952 RepID=A0A2C5Z440_9HYPO|nr:putative enterotoxin [Ophiocordyceps camponoti-rufipedis]